MDGLEKVLKALSMVLILGFTVMTLIQVISRYVFGHPIWWGEQFCRYLFVWMIMLYMPVIVRHNRNLGFDVVVKLLPKKAQDLLWLFCEILIGAFGAYYCWHSIDLCIRFGHKFMEGLRVPAPVMYGSQVVGAAALTLFSIELVVKHIIDIAHGRLEGENT